MLFSGTKLKVLLGSTIGSSLGYFAFSVLNGPGDPAQEACIQAGADVKSYAVENGQFPNSMDEASVHVRKSLARVSWNLSEDAKTCEFRCETPTGKPLRHQRFALGDDGKVTVKPLPD